MSSISISTFNVFIREVCIVIRYGFTYNSLVTFRQLTTSIGFTLLIKSLNAIAAKSYELTTTTEIHLKFA